MDLKEEDAVHRTDFVWALRAFGARVDFQRVIRKARLTVYFRDTAQSLFLEEYIARVFPCITAEDVDCMGRWVTLRKAWHLIHNKTFRAGREDLQRIFNLLLLTGEKQLPISSLLRAHIFTETELRSALRAARYEGSSVSFDDFVLHFQPLLLEKYGNPDPSTPEWIAGARDSFRFSRSSVLHVPARPAWTEDEDGTSTTEVPSISLSSCNQARPGLPRLPLQRRCSNAGRATMACWRLQRATAGLASARMAA
jgi:hypothetical protein